MDLQRNAQMEDQEISSTEQVNPTLIIRNPSNNEATDSNRGPAIRWAEGTVDNELLGRKKSNCCCIYEKQKRWDESSSSSDSSSDDDDNHDDHHHHHHPKRKHHTHCTDHCRGHTKRSYQKGKSSQKKLEDNPDLANCSQVTDQSNHIDPT